MDRGVEIISTVRRRRSWSLEEKVSILDAAFRPGGSVAAAAARYEVSRSLIYLWRRQAREGGIPGVGMVEPPKAEFAPVCVTHDAEAPDDYVAPRSSKSRRSETIEIVLASGHTIKVRDSVDPARLGRIIAVLERGAEG